MNNTSPSCGTRADSTADNSGRTPSSGARTTLSAAVRAADHDSAMAPMVIGPFPWSAHSFGWVGPPEQPVREGAMAAKLCAYVVTKGIATVSYTHL